MALRCGGKPAKPLHNAGICSVRIGDEAAAEGYFQRAFQSDPYQVTQALQGALGPVKALQIRPNKALREEVLVVFDRTFAITGALQLLATLVAFIGVFWATSFWTLFAVMSLISFFWSASLPLVGQAALVVVDDGDNRHHQGGIG